MGLQRPGPFHSTKPVRIWLDGTVIWSTNRYGITQKLDPQFDLPIGGPPYFRAQIDSKKIARFLEALEGKGYLNGKRQLHGMTMLDGPYCDVRVSHGSQQLSLVSCVEYRKVPPDSMAEYNSRGSLNDFIEIWKVTLNGIDALMPQKREQINPRGE